MARIRTIKPEFWEDERIGKLSMGARLLYLGMISHADDSGRLRASDALLKAQVFPYDARVDVASLRRELVEASRVIEYASDGDSFAWIPKFTTHQKIDRPSPSKLPDPKDSTSLRRELVEASTTDQEGKGREGIRKGSISSASADPPAPEEQLVEKWNRTAAPEMPRCQALTDGRRKKATRLLGIVPLASWDTLIAMANGSDFLRGRTERGWKLSLSKMLEQPELALKVIEGNYSNGTGPPLKTTRITQGFVDDRPPPKVVSEAEVHEIFRKAREAK